MIQPYLLEIEFGALYYLILDNNNNNILTLDPKLIIWGHVKLSVQFMIQPYLLESPWHFFFHQGIVSAPVLTPYFIHSVILS